MTVHRRPLLFSAAAAFLLPACISITTKPAPATPPEVAAKLAADAASRAAETVHKPNSDFAIFPTRPGQTVAINIKMPEPPPAKDSTDTTAQKPLVAPGMPIPPPDPAPLQLAGVRSGLQEPPLLAAVRAHIENRPERAIEAIGALAQPNQDFVLAVLPILVRGATADLVGDPSTLAEMVDQLRAAAARLESRAALRVGAALFCREVWAFGRYDPWPPNQTYRPNQQAHLYVEVRHLVSEPTIGPRGEPYL